MCAGSFVIVDVGGQGAAQMALTEDHDVITANAGAKVQHQCAGMKMHQLEGQWESWFDLWQGEREGISPFAIAANI